MIFIIAQFLFNKTFFKITSNKSFVDITINKNRDFLKVFSSVPEQKKLNKIDPFLEYIANESTLNNYFYSSNYYDQTDVVIDIYKTFPEILNFSNNQKCYNLFDLIRYLHSIEKHEFIVKVMKYYIEEYINKFKVTTIHEYYYKNNIVTSLLDFLENTYISNLEEYIKSKDFNYWTDPLNLGLIFND